MTEIDKNLISEYLAEAGEHLEEMESLLLQLADTPESRTLLDEIFRPIHSIKGAAQFMGLERSAHLAHRLEDLLDLLRKGERPSSPEIVELLIAARDRIVRLAEELEATQTEASPVDDIVELITAEIDAEGTAPLEQADVVGEHVEQETVQESVQQQPEVEQAFAAGAYAEENDQELFGIFLENLRERIDLIRTQAGEFAHSSDKVALLQRCSESLEPLRSAASYMGYDELTGIYSNWLEDIVAVQEALARHEEVPYDFMDAYLSEITALFPQIDRQPMSAGPGVGSSPAVQDADTATSGQGGGIDNGMLSDYLIEAGEHLEETESLLLKLAEEPESRTLLDEIFRPIHSIKGAAQFMGLERSAHLAHRLEDLLDLLRKGERPSSPEIVELLIAARDRIVRLAGELETTQTEASPVDDIVEQISAEIDGAGTAAAEPVADPGEDVEAATGSEEAAPEQASQAPAAAVYEEEYDQELFGIFLEHLRERLDLIRTQAGELAHSPDKVVLLERCAESLEALRSAANYMGYEELTEIYSNWLEDIAAVEEALGRNEDVPCDFMDAYLSEIAVHFPQLSRDETDAVAAAEQAVADAPVEREGIGDETPRTDDERLYEKLSDALETATADTAEHEYELLHGVFEEMIAEREQTPVAEQPAVAESGANRGETGKQVAGESRTPARAEQPENAQQPEKGKGERKPAERKGEYSVVKKSVRVDAEKIDSLINQVGELVVDRAYFFQLFEDMRGLQQHFKDEIGLDQKELKQIRAFTYRMGEAIASLSRTSNELQEGVMKVRMLPISALFNRYPRLVHDLTRHVNKKVNLKVEGEDTELDKMVVEKLSDPLIHIIRNAVDHGIEDASERVSAGKTEAGTLFLKSYHESNQVVVEIIDDGRGIDPDRVKAKAIEKGIVSQNEAARMTPQEVVRLITAAGFSTAEQITDTSGRGVGMDIVRKNIEKLNGTLEIESKTGKGTSIRLKIPLTLAIIPAHLVKVGGNMYTIPLANIEETLRISRSETTIIEGTEVVYLRGKTLPIIHLSSLFNTRSYAADKINFFVVVVNTGTQKLGLVVDELLGQEEVVIKPLVDYLRDHTGFSGATIIGDGSISLILDIYEIANMTVNQQIRRQQQLTMMRRSKNASDQAAAWPSA